MADNRLTKAQQAAEPKKHKKVTVEEQPRKGLRAGKSALRLNKEEMKKDPDPFCAATPPFPCATPLRASARCCC